MIIIYLRYRQFSASYYYARMIPQQLTDPACKEYLRYWLALWRAPGIGPKSFIRILEKYPDLTEFFRTSKQTLQSLGIKKPDIDLRAADKDLQWLETAPENAIVTYQHPLYPALLKEIPDPPPVLFVRGNLSLLSTPQIAIVGSRNPTQTGEENANYFAAQLAAAGLTITSGLALGIDTCSHKGALSINGKTIAILGTGLEKIYPYRNQKLADTILAENGTLIAEVPIGTPAHPANFPQRNRIISGLSLGVLVVEATLHSGSLITARLASEQGREVFAIPGSISNTLARGCHLLIKEGAKLIETSLDILEELQTADINKATLQRIETKPVSYDKMSDLDETYLSLLKHLGKEDMPIDALVERSHLSASTLMTMLTTLELKGYVKISALGYRRV